MTTRSVTSAARQYVQVVFATPAAAVDDAAALLVAQGALGCVVGGDHRSAHRRAALTLNAYFDHLSRPRLAAIRRAMAAAGMLADSGRALSPRIVVDPGWATAWKNRFAPLPIGRGLLIVPPWRAGAATDRARIVINPGQAFGTGHHATTCGALATIEKLCAARRFARGLDAGTGSGVLAIAMRMMGVGDVRAIDIDALALENARENAGLNGFGGRGGIRFATTPVARLRRRFDLIAANILSSSLIAMAAPLTRLLAPGGRLILGGILNREAAAVLRAYRPPLRRLEVRRDRGWSTLVLAR
jgi:ribosomal protein L11 methyltransferase